MLFSSFFNGLLLGLSVGLYCIFSCGLCFASYLLLSENIKTKIFLFFLARLFIYLFVGFLTGYLGERYYNFFLESKRTIYIITGFYLILLANFSFINFEIFNKKINAFLLGVISGISPCPPFIAAFSTSFLQGGIINSLSLFFGFFLSSSLMILAVLIPTFFKFKKIIIKKFSQFVLYTMAVLFLFIGIVNINKKQTIPLSRIELLSSFINKNNLVQQENNIYKIYDEKGGIIGIIFFTDEIAFEAINGFNGPVPVMVHIKDNRIQKVELLKNNETPEYINILIKNNFLKQYENKSIFEDFKLDKNIHSYSGATISATAINNGINQSLKKIYNLIRESEETNKRKIFNYLFLIVGLILTLFSLYKKNIKLRRITILYSVIVLGFINKIFLSINSLLTIFSGGIEANYISPFLILFLFTMIFLFFSGKIFCAYLCPFGNLIDIIRFILKKVGIKFFISEFKNFYFLKYIILFIYLFYFLPNSLTYKLEPFIYIFSISVVNIYFVLSILILIYSVIEFRFYCRYLCALNAFFLLLLKLKKLVETINKKIKKN